jgi:hypothetical protein
MTQIELMIAIALVTVILVGAYPVYSLSKSIGDLEKEIDKLDAWALDAWAKDIDYVDFERWHQLRQRVEKLEQEKEK